MAHGRRRASSISAAPPSRAARWPRRQAARSRRSAATARFDGITNGALNNKGIVLVNSQTRLDLAGTINNTGTINEDQEGNSGSTRDSHHRPDGHADRRRQGARCRPTRSTRSTAAAARNQLVNVNNTISGAGQIGTGTSMFLVNQAGGHHQRQSDAALDRSTPAATSLPTPARWRAPARGGLVIWTTAVNNAGGTIQAVGAGSHVDLQQRLHRRRHAEDHAAAG